jgi:pimeloyl-ACP methyl ester carboxylesterase
MIPASRLAPRTCALVALLTVGGAAALAAQESEIPVSCSNPELKMHVGEYPSPVVLHPGNAIEPKTGKPFFLDYPCDLVPGEELTFILNIHGGGSLSNWQRHYFPAFDFKDRYRLIVASPAAGDPAANGSWNLANDREFLDNVFTYVYETFSAYDIGAFWLVGHSQGGMVSRQLVCSEPYRSKVTGFVSLTGGRVGSPTGPGGTPAALPDCEFSHIFSAGEHEAAGMNLSETSLWAERLGCDARVRQRPNLADVQPGYVYDSREANLANMRLSWGRFPGPGTTEWYAYPNCRDDRIVADLIRIDKGHTEGLEPRVTEQILRLMLFPFGEGDEGEAGAN